MLSPNVASATAPRTLQSKNGCNSDCGYGLMNRESCTCDCIPPFCNDAYGACTVPVGTCDGGNPWKDCVVGQTCPWWMYGSGGDSSCTTGRTVPQGTWDVYSSEEECCQAKNPNSNACVSNNNIPPPTPSRTEQPAVTSGNKDLYQNIPIKFVIQGVPDEVNKRDVKEEMLKILKRVLLNLADKVESLKIKSVQETLPVMNRAIDIGVSYDVTVVREDGTDFGKIIKDWIQDSYHEILEEIQDWLNAQRYVGYDLNLNACEDERGQFRFCSKNDKENGEEFQLQPLNVQRVPVKMKFKVDDVVIPLDTLAQQLRLEEMYKDIFAGIGCLDVSVVDTSINSPRRDNVDISIDITSDCFEGDLGALVNETVRRQDDILNQIEVYSYPDMDLEWCINSDGAFTICDTGIMDVRTEQPPENNTLTNDFYGVPLWAIITASVLTLFLCCITCWCFMVCIRNIHDDDEKSDVKVTTAIHTVKPPEERSRDLVVVQEADPQFAGRDLHEYGNESNGRQYVYGNDGRQYVYTH